MMTRRVVPPRPLISWEQEVLSRLLSLSFPGVDELRTQLASVRVSEEFADDDPTVILSVDVQSAPPAPVLQRIPVEATGRDEDGAPVMILLHVVQGYLSELEVYRADGDRLRCAPKAASLSPVTRSQS